MTPKVSVVLLNYNGLRHLEQCMLSVLRTDYPNWELVFVDNGSSDGSDAAFLSEARRVLAERLVFVKIEENIGYSRANNAGLERCSGGIVVLLSNDIEVSTDWLARGVEFFADPRNHDVMVAEAWLRSLSDHQTQDPMGNFVDAIGFCHPFVGDLAATEVFYSEGAVMFIRREVLDSTRGLFDGDYFMFYEDIDFCWRARLAGYRCAVIPSARAFHMRGGTVRGVIMKTDPRYVYFNTRNRLATLYKNYGLASMVVYLPLSIAAELVVAFVLYGRQPETARAKLSGIAQFVRELPQWTRKRRAVQQNRRVGDLAILRAMTPLSEGVKELVEYAKLV